MSFSSLGELLNMGGHALYVWLSYGVALAVMLYNVIAARSQQRRALQDVRERMRREAPVAGGMDRGQSEQTETTKSDESEA